MQITEESTLCRAVGHAVNADMRAIGAALFWSLYLQPPCIRLSQKSQTTEIIVGS